MKSLEKKIINYKKYCGRFFKDDSFFSQTKEVLKKIPREIDPQNFSNELLKPQEEKHLFRKMNYFKYKAHCLLNIQKIDIKKIEFCIKKAKNIRNIIAVANLRLVSQVLKLNLEYQKSHSLLDSIISDAHFDILKSIDYFDWTLGNKFSTYATWVIKKNFFRESKEAQKKNCKCKNIEDTDASKFVSSERSLLDYEIDFENKKKLVVSLLVMLENGNFSKDQKRHVYILERYFGLNGYKNSTLEQISNDLGVTKERIRQLKEKSLLWLRSKVHDLNLDYEAALESFRY